ncbi:hypothetical protein I4U23_005038 [Adineta vaga]|nr:hypothetical protein I4U23_005038 [Adineta vaga]
MNKLTKVHMQDFSFHVNNISEQACRKPVDKIVSISGLSGSDGCSGKPGSNGISGRSSSHFSKAGGNGGRGANGSNGQSGKSGTNSHHALIQLDGSVEKLKMQVKKFKTLDTFLRCSADVDWNLGNLSEDDEYSFQLRESKKIILVKAVGGDGGTGGQGGDGGRGGNGGHGGPGRNGKRGQDIHSEDNSADSGSNGEDGAPGGNGGNGGSGGNGGNGGDAGAGGHIQVRSIDPRLFMLIEVDCQAGLPGKGGEGGKSGSSGTGGVGGTGGRGGRGGQNSAHSFSAYDGSSGAQGSNGTDGSDGKSGKDGLAGDDGRIANHGSIQYIVMNMNGNVAEKGSNKYHATVIDYIIVDENKDSIYEPNSDFFITNVKWTNDGSITLPSGSILSFSSTKYISNDVDDISLLTQTTVNQTFLNSHEFRCHLNAVSIPTINRPYIQPVTITSEINLFNRLLPESQFSTTFLCQYPIQISNIEIPSFLGVDERGIITITFTNISTRPYGTCPDSVGSIEFIFSVHPLIKILPLNEKFLYQVKRDGNGYYKINERITSKSTNYISFEFSLNTDAADQLYQNLPWNVVLLLRNIPIQMHENNIQVAPSFRPNIHTDVLLVTSSQLTRAEFLIYMNLFRLFNYSSQMWDTQRYGAFHHPEIAAKSYLEGVG